MSRNRLRPIYPKLDGNIPPTYTSDRVAKPRKKPPKQRLSATVSSPQKRKKWTLLLVVGNLIQLCPSTACEVGNFDPQFDLGRSFPPTMDAPTPCINFANICSFRSFSLLLPSEKEELMNYQSTYSIRHIENILFVNWTTRGSSSFVS